MYPDSSPEKDLLPEEKKALEQFNQKLTGEISALKNALKISADEYKKVFDQLKEIEQRYSALAENSYDLICEISTVGRFLYVSPNFKAVLGYEPDELLNQPFTDLLHPDEQNEVRRIFKKAIAGLSVQQVLTRIRHKNSDWYWFESAGTGFKSISGEVRVVVISRNVNQRRLMEDELLKAQKLDSLGILAGGIAHDS